MKKQIVIAILTLGVLVFAGGCIATQQEVQDLTNTVNQIVPAVREEVAKANVNIEDVLTKVETVNKAVVAAESPVEAIEKGWKVSEAWNPYYAYGVIGLTILRLFQKKKESDNALEEVVIGVEDSKKNGGNLRAAFNATESLLTRRKVAKILSNT